jgi:hypothetical protein
MPKPVQEGITDDALSNRVNDFHLFAFVCIAFEECPYARLTLVFKI